MGFNWFSNSRPFFQGPKDNGKFLVNPKKEGLGKKFWGHWGRCPKGFWEDFLELIGGDINDFGDLAT